MSVLSRESGRGDLHIRRGVSEAYAVSWTWDEGHGPYPVDLTDWTAECVLRSPQGDVWLTVPCTTHADGLAVARFSHDAFADPVWAGRPQGSWHMNATSPTGHVERLGDGYFYLEG